MSVLLLWMSVHYMYAGQLRGSVIIIIRHAEKPDAGDGLAPAGDARANAYVGCPFGIQSKGCSQRESTR